MPCGDALCGDVEVSYHGEELGYGITVRYQQHSRVSARGNTCDQQAFERRSPALARVVEVTTLPCGIHWKGTLPLLLSQRRLLWQRGKHCRPETVPVMMECVMSLVKRYQSRSQQCLVTFLIHRRHQTKYAREEACREKAFLHCFL